MNAKDIAKALKCCYPIEEGISTCEGCPFDGITEPHCTERNIEYHAGEIIESILSQLDAAIAGQETLQKALIESQRRERAAVEDMRKLKCFICKKYKISCWPYRDELEGGCAAFEWRGPVEGGEV